VTNPVKHGSTAARLSLAVGFGLLAVTLGGVLAAPAYADGHDHDRRWNDARHDRDRHNDYYRGPTVYYTAPPVVYAPPGASLNFSFPLVR